MDATTIKTVSGIGGSEVSAKIGLSTREGITLQPPTGSNVEDVVELSSEGVALSRADVQSQLRAARISEIRAEIKAGVFLTPERVDGIVERLLEVLG